MNKVMLKLNQWSSLPLVSVIIPTHNGQNNLKECLSSIEKTKYPKYEVLVVDAASTNGTRNMLKRDFPNVKVFRVGDIGYGETNNHGMIRSQGEYIISICDDYTVHPNWLDELVKVISSSKKIGIVGGKVYFYGTKNRIASAGGKITSSAPGISLGFGRNDCRKYNVIKETDFTPVPMVARDILDKVGLWDPDYFLYFDDTDFCFRVKKAGYKVVYVPTAIFWHKIGGTTPLGSPRSMYLSCRNQIRFIMKNFPVYALFVSIPYSLIFFLARALRFLLYNRTEEFKSSLDALISAIIWNFKHMRETIQARSNPYLQSFQRLPPQQLGHFRRMIS
jgi:GT2 family glycosyltransferase